jgi:hypothetical protein
MAGAALPRADVNVFVSNSMDFTDGRDCQTLHSSVVVDMTAEAADSCFNENHVHSWFGHPCCWLTTVVRTILFLIFLPFILIQVLLQLTGIYKACVTNCGITCLADVPALMLNFAYKNTVEFDYNHRTVILRLFRRFCCLCSYTLVREQSLPFERIDSFKFSHFHDDSSVPAHWMRSGSLVLMAVKRPLGDAKDGFLPLALPSGGCCSNCFYSSSEKFSRDFSQRSDFAGYTWPAFIRRKLMNHGDLLVLDYKTYHDSWNVNDECDPYRIRACHLAPRKVATKSDPKTVEEMFNPIVSRLNECLVQHR